MTNAYNIGFTKTPQEISLDRLPVQGKLPVWLRGSLIRNGPGTFEVGRQRYRHWFDGLAMLHRFSFADGQVSYANKFLETQAYRAAVESGRISYSEFATDPCRSLFGRVMAVFSPKITDSAKVSIAQIADRFLALAETPIQVEFDPATLAAVGVFNYEQGATGQMTTVHPHIDYARDELYNLVTRYHRLSHYRFYRLKAGGSPALVGELPVKQPAYIHSFGMSQNYLILAEFPLRVNPLKLLLQLKPYIENFRWQPERGTPFWLVHRRTGKLAARIESDPFFAFHHVNAFEQGDELVVDIVAYPDADVIQAFYLNRLSGDAPNIPFGQLRRYRLPLSGQKPAGYEVISDVCVELPHFDYRRFNMDRAYRFVYGVSIAPEHRQEFYNQLVKIDLHTGQAQRWFAANCYPGEPIFVGAPGRAAEDDGVILSVVLDAAKGTSFLLLLDARSFQEQARAEIPQPVLFGYHGAYFEGI